MKRRVFREIVAEALVTNARALMKKARLANRIAKLPGLDRQARQLAYARKGDALSRLQKVLSETRVTRDARFPGREVLSFEAPGWGFRLHILPEQFGEVARNGISQLPE